MSNMSPCPFCGSFEVSEAKEMESNQYSTYASCNKCGAEGPYSRHDPIEANAKWNTRANRIIPTSKLHKHVYGESLWVRLSDAEAIEKELEEWKKVASLFKTSFDAHLNEDEDLRDKCYIDALALYEKLSSK